MKKYSESQVKKLKPKVFSALAIKGGIQVKAYLKENAFSRIQEFDNLVQECDVRLSQSINSHQSPCDQIVE